jgi:hypothetical protein
MSAVLYLGVTAALGLATLWATDGQFTYPLDDTYIHLTVARTLAESGTWGLRPGEFAGVSSSPLWTTLLAGVVVLVGTWEIAPLILNLVGGLAVLWFADRLIRRAGWEGEHALRWLAAFVMVVPLPTLALTGMEHTLQLALTLWLLEAATANAPRLYHLAGLSAALLACRYEGAFVETGLAIWLARRGRYSAIVAVGFGALAPILGYAAMSAAHGGAWLPNSVLVKAGAPDSIAGLSSALGRVSTQLVASLKPRPELFLALFAVLIPRTAGRAAGALLTTIFLVAVVAQSLLVPIRVFFRYEASVVGLGILAAATLVPAFGRTGRMRTLIIAGAAALAVGTLALRAVEAIARTPDGCRNVYEQQRQMARFLGGYGSETTVAVNDIGAVSYFSKVQVLDLAGLATQEVSDFRRQGTFDSAAMTRLAREHGADLAIVYPEYFVGRTAIPESWVQVQRWRIENRASAAFDTVGFYATSHDGAKALSHALDAFTPSLPDSVRVEPSQAGTSAPPAL